jgi:hypothetical protein
MSADQHSRTGKRGELPFRPLPPITANGSLDLPHFVIYIRKCTRATPPEFGMLTPAQEREIAARMAFGFLPARGLMT